MDSIFTNEDRLLIANLTAELKRLNDRMDSRDAEPDFVLSIQQAASLVGKTRQTISRKIREGKLHKVERRGQIGILYSELNMTQNRREAGELQ
jgi:hypothetical protein